MRTCFNAAIVFLLVLFIPAIAMAQEVNGEQLRINESPITCVVVSEVDSDYIYVGTDREVLSSTDAGKTWKREFSVAGDDQGVYGMAFDQSQSGAVYVATGNGLYRRNKATSRWQKIFHGRGSPENRCTAVAAWGNRIYLGSKAGLFTSRDKGKTWNKALFDARSNAVLSIAHSRVFPDICFVACTEGLFLTTDAGTTWKKIYHAMPTDKEYETLEDDGQDSAEPISSVIRQVALDEEGGRIVYLATSRGVIKSLDNGRAWERVTHEGLSKREVESVIVLKGSSLCASTKNELFVFNGQRWNAVSLPAGGALLCLYSQRKNVIYTGFRKGLYRVTLKEATVGETRLTPVHYQRNEPSIHDVQQAAIRYAEVSPEKIIRWRDQARKKAWWPKMALGINRNTTDLWHWESGSTTKQGDDELLRGQDSLDWDVSFAWDLGELIYSDDQTAIDARSRLMVQLRADILDEVNKLYFERIRVKNELDSLTLEERKKRFDKELRLFELTASLDGLTGSYFSLHSGPGLGVRDSESGS